MISKNNRGDDVYAEIVRRSSGVDSGEIDFSLDVDGVEKMEPYDKKESIIAASMLLCQILKCASEEEKKYAYPQIDNILKEFYR